MTARQSNFNLLLLCFTTVIMTSCDTTRNIYKNSTSKKDYLEINAVTLTHCGCTHLYADNYKNGKLTFQIFYNDNIARKTLFNYAENSMSPQKYSLLATTSENFTTPFDSLDLRVFNAIDSAIITKRGIIYPVRSTKYRGYVADTLLIRN